MKDLYSFHPNQRDFENYYQKVTKSYIRIFKRCGLKVLVVEASGSGFTNKITHEFQVLTPTGEDTIIYCPKCNFAQNKEIAKNKKGQNCPKCKKEKLVSERGIEVGNIFPLGVKYSKELSAYFTDKDGKTKPIIMGCYGIGLGRLMATVVEIHHDKKGIIWPKELAPFLIHLIPVEIKDNKVRKTSDKIYQDLQKLGVEVLYDDRVDVSIGEKFAESDLIGIPLRIVVSKKTLKAGKVEIKERSKTLPKLIKISQIKTKLIL
jgi:prolyl-tRNA synthetase